MTQPLEYHIAQLGRGGVEFEVGPKGTVFIRLDHSAAPDGGHLIGRMTTTDVDMLIKMLSTGAIRVADIRLRWEHEEEAQVVRDALQQLRGALRMRKGPAVPVEELAVQDQLHTLLEVMHHRMFVGESLLGIRQDLERRAAAHDESKLRPDEFPGYTRLGRAWREGPGEYKNAQRQERLTTDRHHKRYRHHPEHFRSPANQMGWLDIIEMVAEWFANWRVQNPSAPGLPAWEEEIHRYQTRYKDALNAHQWWLVHEVGRYLYTITDFRAA